MSNEIGKTIVVAANTYGLTYNSIAYGGTIIGARVGVSDSNYNYANGAYNESVGNGASQNNYTRNTSTNTLNIEYSTTRVKVTSAEYNLDESLSITITTPKELYVFALNSNDTASCGTWKLYSLKMYDLSNNLIRDYVPVLDKKNVACLYDLVEGRFYYNAGTGTFTAGNTTGEPVAAASVAEKAQEIYYGVKTKITPIEYIKAQGNQCIITDYSPNSNTKIEIKVKYDNSTSAEALFTARDYSGSANINNFIVFKLANGQFRADYGASPGTGFSHTINTTDDYTYVMDGNGLYENGTLIQALTAQSFQTTNPITFFQSYQVAPAVYQSNLSTYTMYYCKIYENDVLVREYIPALIDDTEYALYETVEGRIFYNQWHGSFLGGDATGESFYIEKARKVTRAYVGVSDVARLSYAKETLPAGCAHLFHLDGSKYDALGNYMNSSGVQQEIATTGSFGTHPGWNGCSQISQINNAYCFGPSETDIVKTAGKEWTLQFWANKPFEFKYGGETSTPSSQRIMTLRTTTTSLYVKIGSGDGSWSHGAEGSGAYTEATATISIADNQWHHYAFVVTGDKKFYAFMDGTKLISKDLTTPERGGSTWGTTGVKWFVKNSGTAYIDELAIFDKALWTDDFTPPQAPYDT